MLTSFKSGGTSISDQTQSIHAMGKTVFVAFEENKDADQTVQADAQSDQRHFCVSNIVAILVPSKVQGFGWFMQLSRLV